MAMTVEIGPKKVMSRLRTFWSKLLNLREWSLGSVVPLLLLLIGMSTVVGFVQDRGYFYRNTWNPSDHFEWLSSHNLTLAVNLSPSHNFLGFVNQSVDAEGNIDYGIYKGDSSEDDSSYHIYNRFPPGGYMLIKLVTLPFGDDLSNRIFAARMLMLGFFVGTALLVYWSLCRLVSSRWISSAVTLTVFASTPFLLFNDMIVVELGPDIFGFALTFHSMVIFAQEGRFRQLVFKACLALCLGWHVMALLLTFIILNIAREVIQGRTKAVRDLLKGASQFVVLGIIALGVGILILAYNIGNEYYALSVRGVHQLALFDLPSLQSILFRTGLSQEGSPYSVLGIPFFEGQLSRIGLISLPFILSDSLLTYSDLSWQMIGARNLFVGIVVVGICMIGLFLVRYRLLAMTAVFSGFIWAILMRRFAIRHGFDALFYVGIPIFFYTSILLLVRKRLGERLIPLGSLITLFVFIFSSYRMSYTDRNDREVEFHKSVVDDFSIIRNFTGGKSVFIPFADTYSEMNRLVGAAYGLQYYLSGSSIIFNNYGCDYNLDEIDFILQVRRENVPSLLTPDNQMFFLYTRNVYEERIDELVEEGRPVIANGVNVYLTDDRELVYIVDRCDRSDLEAIFSVPVSLAIYPIDVEDLTDPSQGHELMSLNVVDYYVIDTERYILIFDLPDYDIAKIRTWQDTDKGRMWGGSFFGPEHVADLKVSQQMDNIVVSSELIMRNGFDVYLTDDKSLLYIREPCLDGDISGEFFIHVVPEDTKYLPEHRMRYGFDNLDFIFVDHGIRYDQKCAAEIKLPGYDIASIFTGQFTERGPIWQASSTLSDS